jgi:acyl-CoA thioester hydrolase
MRPIGRQRSWPSADPTAGAEASGWRQCPSFAPLGAPPPTRSSFPHVPAHRTRLRVRFAELDPYNHVNHSVYLTYFEAGRVEAMLAVGLDLAKLATEGWQLLIVDLAVSYRAAAVANDVLVVETGLVDIRGASTRWHQQVLREVDSSVLVTAEIRAGVTDSFGRPRRIPPHMVDALASLLITH